MPDPSPETRPLLAPQDAVRALAERVVPVDIEQVAIDRCGGRILAEAITADRDSPACDVSAMDGFACRAAEITAGPLILVGECPIGQPPRQLEPGQSLRIYTGSPLPTGADTVVKLEDMLVEADRVALLSEATAAPDDHIRVQGENTACGARVLEPGIVLTSVAAGAAATFGHAELAVRRQLQVAVLVTGDEVASPAEVVQPWQLRDFNGPALRAFLAGLPWASTSSQHTAVDEPKLLREGLAAALAAADVVILTGGVSKGNYDFVPRVVAELGAEIIFHRLPIRPGKPVLGAVIDGKPIFGLPGNPLAVAVTARRLVLPVLAQRAGLMAFQAATHVTLDNPDEQSIDLYWYRPVTLSGEGRARWVDVRGSGDTAGAAASDGFIEVPPAVSGPGPYAYYGWQG